MFIENLRHVKKKRKIPVMILIGLLVVGLLASFAYLGTSFGNLNGTGASGDQLDYYAELAETADKTAKQKSDDAESLLAAIDAYESYAAYQMLYLDPEGAQKSYKTMLAYTDKLLALYDTQETDAAAWLEAYTYAIGVSVALEDESGASRAFRESFNKTTLTSAFIDEYSQLLGSKEMYKILVDDIQACVDFLTPQVSEEELEAAAEKLQSGETTDEPETLADVLSTANSTLQYAQMMASMNMETQEVEIEDEAAESNAEDNADE